MRYLALIILTYLWTPSLLAQSAEREPQAAFQVDQLSGSQLEGFRLKGAEKVTDFVELLERYQDKTLPLEIRKQCKQMIIDLFEKEDSQIYYFDHQKLKRTKLTALLNNIQKLKRPLVVRQLEGSDARLQPLGDTYLLKTKLELLSTTKAKADLRKQVNLEVIIKKEIKRFGSEEIEIWQVFLGNMSIPVGP